MVSRLRASGNVAGRFLSDKTSVFALACLWIVPAAILFFARRFGWMEVWNSLGIRSINPPFLDLRGIPAGIQTYHYGGDPLVANPFDPLQRPLNYPRIWMHIFSFLHIDDQHVWIVGILLCALYLLCVSTLIVRAKSTWERLALLVAGLSLAAMFALERGNTDLLVFSLVFLGCILPKNAQRAWIFLIATVLKLYPLVVMVAEVIRQQGRKRILPIALLAVVAVLFVLQWHDLVLIQEGTPRSAYSSYGLPSLEATFRAFLFEDVFSTRQTTNVSRATIVSSWLTARAIVVICRMALLLIMVRVWRSKPRLDRDLLQSPAGQMFFAFGTIYVATYAIASNFDYRLIFLIPTLPFAFGLIRNPKRFRFGLSYILCVLFAQNWICWTQGQKPQLGHLATLALYFLIAPILVQQVKSYLSKDITTAAPALTEVAEIEPTIA